MNTPKHTPGPWIVNGDGNVESHFGAIVEVCGAGFGCDDETKPNAALISAAPELLEALRESVKWLQSAQADEPQDYHNAPLDDAIEQALAAIAKAEGRR